jgi:hypothetical protein
VFSLSCCYFCHLMVVAALLLSMIVYYITSFMQWYISKLEEKNIHRLQ